MCSSASQLAFFLPILHSHLVVVVVAVVGMRLVVMLAVIIVYVQTLSDGTCRIRLVKTKLIDTCILSLRSSVTAITEAQPQFESNFVMMSFSKLSQHLGLVSSACY